MDVLRMPWVLGCCVAVAGCQEIESAGSVTHLEDDASTLDGGSADDGSRVGDAGLRDAAPDHDARVADRDGGLPDRGPPGDGEVAPPHDAAPAPDVAPGPDMAPGPDAAPLPTPVDVACDRPWVRLFADEPPPCAHRRVFSLGVISPPRALAIARSGQGRALVGWEDQQGVDEGTYELRFVDGQGDVLDAHTIEPRDAFGETVAVASALAVLRETFHLVTWRVTDLGGQIEYRQVSPDGVVGQPEVVAGAVGRRGDVDVVVEPDGDVHVAWHDKSAGRIYARARSAGGGEWGRPVELDADLELDTPGDGAVALAVGDARVLHAAYQLSQSRFGAAPRARTLVGEEWGLRRTLDNHGNDRVSGVSIDLAAHGDRRAAAYLDWVGGTGEVRLARWGSGDGEVGIESRVPRLPLAQAPGHHPLALAVDGGGRLHLVVAVRQEGRWALEYHRQSPVVGPPGWLVDTIDDDLESVSQARVDLYVDVHRQPHVVYYDPGSGMVAYATLGEP